MAITSEERKRFEELGEAQVRLIFMTRDFGGPFQKAAPEWLAEFDEAERSRMEALQTEQTRLAQSASKAAWIAAYAAIGAVVVTIIGTIITVLAWIHPHQ